MAATPSAWRTLAAILRIAALLALALPSAANAHAGDYRVGHAHVAPTHAQANAQTFESSHSHDARSDSVIAAPGGADDPQAHDSCCPGCCSCSCHVFGAGPAETALRFDRTDARAMPRAPNVAFATMTPEALPEPPRSFA